MDSPGTDSLSSQNRSSGATSTIPLDMIAGLHSRVLELEMKHAGIPPYRSIPSSHMTDEAILSILFLRPVICKRTGSKLACVGNVRSYQLARDNLKGETRIPYILLERRRIIEIDRLFWAERLLIPITAELNQSGGKWLYALWESRHTTWDKIWHHPPLNKIRSRRAFAKLLGMDARSLE